MEKDWLKIYSSTDTMIIELVRQLLTDSAIQVVNINKKDSAYLFGVSELYVHNNDFAASIEVISQIDFSGDTPSA